MTEAQLGWDSFLVRIWRETTSNAWRGQIMHLPTHTTVYFNTFEQLQAFMATYVPAMETPPEAGRPATDGAEKRS